MSYQAVIRNAANELVTSKPIGIQISILQGISTGTPVYIETQTPNSNQSGLISLEIGTGNIISGDLTTINWANGPYFIKTETDPVGGINYTITGTSQLMSVPYALHAKSAESISGAITEIDPVYNASVASDISAVDTSNWNNKLGSFTEADPDYNASIASSITAADTNSWNNKLGIEVDGSITNELQSLSLANDSLSIQNGNAVDLSGFRDTNWTKSGNYLFNASDSLGIGVSTPNEKLEILGNIKLSGIIIEDTNSIPVLLNAWSNYGFGYEPAGYFKDKEGTVHFKGMIKNGTAIGLFVLPVGYRPNNTRILLGAAGFGSTKSHVIIYISNTGVINYQNATLSGTPDWISLDMVSFRP